LEKDPKSQSIIQASCNFLGVESESIAGQKMPWENNKKEAIAVLLSYEYLGKMSPTNISLLYNRLKNGELSLMIVINGEPIKPSNRIVQGVTTFSSKISEEGFLNFSKDNKDLLKELSGLQVPVKTNGKGIFLKTIDGANHKADLLMYYESKRCDPGGLMVKQIIGKGRLYLSTLPKCELEIEDGVYKNVASILPFIIFIKSSFGDRCWHREKSEANFIIDDPWLIEPYGNLSYQGLLQEMKKANFHTTIAFIPWNYDRSKKEVVKILLDNSDRYSISVHGNNHDHQEFGGSKKVPLYKQQYDILQSVARMEEFKKLTGIRYDRVMVFPHRISPEETISLLKKENFLATINSEIVPLGSKVKIDFEDMIFPAELKFYGFPLLRRYSPSISKSIICFDLFFEKPLVFYTHQDYFSNDINAFNETAEYVNKKAMKKIEWVGLEKLCQNLYMQRIRDDGGYDIRMFCREISIRNECRDPSTYRVVNIETGTSDIEKAIIGESVFYSNIELELKKPIRLNPGQNITIKIIYKEAHDSEKVKVDEGNLRVYILRTLSDFRDLVLSKSKIGRGIIGIFNRVYHS
jgi:hypothetical protein